MDRSLFVAAHLMCVLAPSCSSSSMTPRWLLLAARCSAVQPALVTARMLEPRRSSSLQASTLPLKAALCSAVQPALLCASTGLPRSNSISSACSAQVTRIGVCAGPDVVVAVVAVSTDRHFACICRLVLPTGLQQRVSQVAVGSAEERLSIKKALRVQIKPTKS